MAGRLSGKVAVVTAAGQGIGRSSVLAFAAEGAKVWATDINQAALADLKAAAPGIETARLDVRDGDAVEAFARARGAVDVLVNCAGFVQHGTIPHCSQAAWDFPFRNRNGVGEGKSVSV